MNELFIQLGLHEKEARLYQFLLEQTAMTAASIAKHIDESRTNTYMILERLEQNGLVESDDSKAVRRYLAADPQVLRRLLVAQQSNLKQANTALNQALPKLQSLYNLGQLKPGVVYLEGLDGLKTLLDDVARSGEEVLIIPSEHSPNVPEAWKVLQEGVNKRAKLGVKTRIIFPEGARENLEFDRLKGQEYNIRFWGGRDYPGELVVYGDKCVFTTYHPQVINTILTDAVISQTLRMLFEDLWDRAKA